MALTPNALIARTYFARGALLWAGTRALLSAAFFLGNVDPIRLTLGSILIVMVAVIVVGIADLTRRHERPLLENLGLSRATIVAFFSVPALLGEMIIAMAGAMRA